MGGRARTRYKLSTHAGAFVTTGVEAWTVITAVRMRNAALVLLKSVRQGISDTPHLNTPAAALRHTEHVDHEVCVQQHHVGAVREHLQPSLQDAVAGAQASNMTATSYS